MTRRPQPPSAFEILKARLEAALALTPEAEVNHALKSRILFDLARHHAYEDGYQDGFQEGRDAGLEEDREPQE